MAVIASEGYQAEAVLGFDHEKSVQTIGFFLARAGEPVDKLKLVKLLYLADRLSLEQRGRPLNFEEYYSMKHGPVVSSALNGMNGQLRHRAWARLALGNDRKAVTSVGPISDDHLSRADLRILNAIWEQFGSKTASQLREWTHTNCKEYIEVESSRIAILVDEILEAVGHADHEVAARELKFLQRQMGKLSRVCGS